MFNPHMEFFSFFFNLLFITIFDYVLPRPTSYLFLTFTPNKGNTLLLTGKYYLGTGVFHKGHRKTDPPLRPFHPVTIPFLP